MLMVLDRKEDFKGLTLHYPDFVYFHWKDFYDNPLRPPADDDSEVYFPYFLELFSNNFDFRVATRNLMGRRLKLLYERSGYNENRVHCPTMEHLCDDLERLKIPLISTWARQRETAVDRLQGCLTIFGDNIASRRYADWERLLDIDFGLSLLGVPTDYANFYISVLVLKLLFLKIRKRQLSSKYLNLVVIDECATIFRRMMEMRESAPAILPDLMVQSRESKVGFLLASQGLVDLSYVVQANCARKAVVGGFGLGKDWDIFASSVALDKQKEEFSKSKAEPGYGFGWDPRYPYAFSLKVPYIPINKDVPEQFLKDRLKRYEELIFREEPPIDTEPCSSRVSGQEEEASSKHTKEEKRIRLSPDADRVLRILSLQKCPYLFQSQIFELAGITSGAKQERIKRELLGQGFIREHTLQLGKGFPIFWEITEKGFSYLFLEPPQAKGKGGWLHQAVGYFVKEWAKRNNFNCRLEAQIGHEKKAVDALLTRDTGEVWIMEFVFSEPVEKEIINLVKDFQSELDISKLIFACRDSNLKRKLQQKLESHLELKEYLKKTELSLATDYCLI